MDLIFLIILLIINGAFCAFLSSLFMSIPQDEQQEKIDSDGNSSKRLSKMKHHYNISMDAFNMVESFSYMLATVLTGAIIISEFNNWHYLIYTFVIIIIISFLLRSLLFALGLRYGERVVSKFSPILTFYSYISKPFLFIVKYLNKNIGGANTEESSREELDAMVESAREEGSLDADEYRLLKNIMHFSEVIVSDVMTPRTVVFSCKAEQTVSDVMNLSELQMYSRFPIWDGESIDDDVVGYVMTKDVLHAALIGKKNIKLRNYAREVYFIPENAQLDIALELFLKRKQHQFLVVDEYGGIEGLLTMEDVLETMLGVEIIDEVDTVVDLRQSAKEQRDKRVASIAMQYEKDE